MNLLDYLYTPSLDSYQLKNGEFYNDDNILRDNTFSKLDFSKIEVSLLGVPFAEDNSYDSRFVDSVRSELAKLASIPAVTSVLDIGNLVQGKTLNDTLTALENVVTFLHKHNVFVIVISDLKLVIKSFLESLGEGNYIKIVQVNPRFSIYDTLDYLSKQNQKNLYYTNIGYQSYYIYQRQLNRLNNNNFDSYRLGEARKHLPEIEPIIRDSITIDISLNSLKQQEAPGQRVIAPNGFYSEEICQIAKYAGAGDFLKIANISGFQACPDVQTAKLTAQIVWFIIEGYGCRVTEDPANDLHIKKFNVNSGGPADKIVFYKSDKTERWWVEIPQGSEEKKIMLPSNYKDYIEACNKQIPDRFFKAMQKYNFRDE